MSHSNYTLKPKHIKHLLKPAFKAPHYSSDLNYSNIAIKPSKQQTTHIFATASDLQGVFESFLHLAL